MMSEELSCCPKMARSVYYTILYKMVRQQEVRNALVYVIHMLAIRAHELPLYDLRLNQQRMQVLQHLLIQRLPLRRLWLLLRQRREPQLGGGDAKRLPLDAREDVGDELRVEVDLFLHELGVLKVEREGER